MRSRGFTLLEVMIALAIFAISALVILEQTSRSIRQQSQLENKTLAVWIAENHLARLRLQPRWPDTGNYDTQETFTQRNWEVRQAVEQTANPLLRKATVSVLLEDQDAPLVTLQGFIGEH